MKKFDVICDGINFGRFAAPDEPSAREQFAKHSGHDSWEAMRDARDCSDVVVVEVPRRLTPEETGIVVANIANWIGAKRLELAKREEVLHEVIGVVAILSPEDWERALTWLDELWYEWEDARTAEESWTHGLKQLPPPEDVVWRNAQVDDTVASLLDLVSEARARVVLTSERKRRERKGDDGKGEGG